MTPVSVMHVDTLAELHDDAGVQKAGSFGKFFDAQLATTKKEAEDAMTPAAKKKAQTIDSETQKSKNHLLFDQIKAARVLIVMSRRTDNVSV